MDNPIQDPEDVFWSLIESEPWNPNHRLLFADWCDENNKPVMGDIQRWLVATGRHPKNIGSFWCWERSEENRSPSTLPKKLFRYLPTGCLSRGQNPTAICRSFREAEELLVPAWQQATKRRWIFGRWRPNFTPVTHSPTISNVAKFKNSSPLVERFVLASTKWIIAFLLIVVIVSLLGLSPSGEDKRLSDLRQKLYSFRQATDELAPKITSESNLLPFTIIDPSSFSVRQIIEPAGRSFEKVRSPEGTNLERVICDYEKGSCYIHLPEKSTGIRDAKDSVNEIHSFGWEVSEDLVITNGKISWSITAWDGKDRFQIEANSRKGVWEKAIDRASPMGSKK
jgi:hypothetical protein